MVGIKCPSCGKCNELTLKEFRSRRTDCEFCGANLYATREGEHRVRPKKKRRSPYRRAWGKKRG